MRLSQSCMHMSGAVHCEHRCPGPSLLYNNRWSESSEHRVHTDCMVAWCICSNSQMLGRWAAKSVSGPVCTAGRRPDSADCPHLAHHVSSPEHTLLTHMIGHYDIVTVIGACRSCARSTRSRLTAACRMLPQRCAVVWPALKSPQPRAAPIVASRMALIVATAWLAAPAAAAIQSLDVLSAGTGRQRRGVLGERRRALHAARTAVRPGAQVRRHLGSLQHVCGGGMAQTA